MTYRPQPQPRHESGAGVGLFQLDGGNEPTKHGFATAEYDGESSCFAMGMRRIS
jgi:hypothetical protein